MINCPICDCTISKPINELFDDRYGYKGLFSYKKCQDCKHIYLNEEFTEHDIDNLYTEYYPRASYDVNKFTPMMKEYRSFLGWLNGENSSASFWVPRHVRILDIGCGCGESIAYHKERGCNAFGVEADKNVQMVKERYNLNIKIGLFNSKMFENNYFDYITLQQVIEHMRCPIEEVNDISKVLNSEGVLIFSTPNSNSLLSKIFRHKWIHWHTPFHLNLFNNKSMKRLADKCSLKIIKSQSVTNSNWLYYQLNHLVFYPQHGAKSIFWTGSGNQNKNLIKNITFKILYILYKVKVIHIISRLIDVFNAGDNRVYILKKR